MSSLKFAGLRRTAAVRKATIGIGALGASHREQAARIGAGLPAVGLHRSAVTAVAEDLLHRGAMTVVPVDLHHGGAMTVVTVALHRAAMTGVIDDGHGGSCPHCCANSHCEGVSTGMKSLSG